MVFKIRLLLEKHYFSLAVTDDFVPLLTLLYFDFQYCKYLGHKKVRSPEISYG